MTSEDEKEFGMLMASLAEVFDSGDNVSPVKVELYFRLLAGYSIEDVTQGVDGILKNRVYASLPKPADIIQAIEGDKEEEAVLAWEKVDKAVRLTGPYKSVQFDDPVVHSVIQFIGGWEKLCMTEEKEWKWKQKEFERIYTIMVKRGGHPTYLIGITEAHNSVRFKDDTGSIKRIGFDDEQVKRIAN